MNIRAAISVCFAMTCLMASSQTTVRDLRLDSPVDTNTIAVAYSAISNAVATAVRLGQLDQESLARAVAVGQDLHLVETSTNGWVVGVSNIVEVDQAHIPGVLFVGSTIYGAPRDGGYISITGSPFFYDRQIPGEADPLAGFGEVVTDPYMDWRLGSFFQQWGATNAAMWAALMDINNLPASLASDLQAYSSATGQLANVSADIVSAKSSALTAISAVRDEVNATNAVIRSVIDNAISQASSGGGGQSWTTSSTSSSVINCADHCITICDNSSDFSFTINLPTSTGAAHCRVVFTEAYSLGQNGAWIDYAGVWYGTGNYDCSGFRPYDSYGYEMDDPNTGDPMYYSMVVVDIQEAGSGLWLVDWKGYR